MSRIGNAAFVALALVVASTACKKVSDEAPQPAPDGLIATVSVKSLQDSIGGLRKLVDATKPGAGGFVSEPQVRGGLATMLHATSLDGLDVMGTVHLVIVDDGKAKGVALVAKATDAKMAAKGKGAATLIEKRGWAVLGDKDVVEVVAPYALTTLVAGDAPSTLTMTIDLARVMTRYTPDLMRARDALANGAVPGAPASGMQMMIAYLDGVIALGNESKRAVISLSADATEGTFAIRLEPKEGTRLATFIAAQKPSDYPLIGKLPADGSPIVGGGRIALGPYRDGALAMIAEAMGAGGLATELVAPMAALMTASTGEIGASLAFGPDGMRLSELFGVDDEPAAKAAVSDLMKALAGGKTFETMGIKSTMKSFPDAGTHDGVTLGGYETSVDLSTLPAAQQEVMQRMMARRSLIGIFDKVGMLTVGTEGLPLAARAIDAVRGKAPVLKVTPATQAMFDASKARKDSFVMAIDMKQSMLSMSQLTGAAMPPINMELGLGLTAGFTDGALTFRFIYTPRPLGGQP